MSETQARPNESAAVVEAEGFRILLSLAQEQAEEEGIVAEDLGEMSAINEMRLVAESIEADDYILYSGC